MATESTISVWVVVELRAKAGRSRGRALSGGESSSERASTSPREIGSGTAWGECGERWSYVRATSREHREQLRELFVQRTEA